MIYILSHPIQYYAPLFKYIHQSGLIPFDVMYLSDHGVNLELDMEFGVKFKWDVPLLEDYPHKFIKNNSWRPGIYRGFFGLMNFGIIGYLRKLPKRSVIIVPGWSSFSFILAIVVGKMFGHIVCLRSETALNHELAKPKYKQFVRKFILRRLLFKFINKFLYIGLQNKEFYKYFGIEENKLIFTPYAVNNTYFSENYEKCKLEHYSIKSKLNIPEGYRIILFSGKLIEKKRPVDLLLAFCMAQTVRKSFLIFMGEGELRSELETIIIDKNLSNVLITGFVNQSMVSEFYSIADVFVMCSGKGETWGLSTNEAMNFGLPVIISDASGCSADLVKGNGFVFKETDLEDLAQKLSVMLSLEDSQLTEMGRKSLEIVDQYSYKKILENLLLIG